MGKSDAMIVRKIRSSDVKDVVQVYMAATIEMGIDGAAFALLDNSLGLLIAMASISALCLLNNWWRVHIGVYALYLVLPIMSSYLSVHLMPAKDVARADTYFDKPKHAMFVVEIDGQVVGTAGIKTANVNKRGWFSGLRKDGDAELVRVNIHPAHQGKGISRLLMDAALKFAQEEGYKRMILSSSTLNRVAVGQLYPKYGFLKEKDVHIILGIRPVFMSKVL